MSNYPQLLQDIAGTIGVAVQPDTNAATISSWIQDSANELAAQAANIIADAEWDLARDLTVQQLKKIATGNLVVAVGTLNRPADLISPEHLSIAVANSPVTGLSLTFPGLGYNAPPVWTFSNNAAAQCSVNALGQVVSSTFMLTSAGNAVATAPTVTASAPTAGNTATATATIAANTTVFLRLREREYLDAAYPATTAAQPAYYGVGDATTYVLKPVPDQAYPYAFEYIAKPTALSLNAPTNVYTDNFYELLRARCLAHASYFQLDWDGKANQVALWEGRYTKLLAQINGTNDRASRDLTQQPFWVADNRIGQPPPTGNPGA